MPTPKFTSLSESGNGRFCSFFVVGNTGYKLYTSKKRALACLRTQRFFYKLGLAPKPGKYFTLKRFNYGWRYGYTTEVADIAENQASYHIYDVLSRMNIKYWDCAYFNLGTIRGKHVIVDCDPEEFHYKDSLSEFRKLAKV